MHCKGYLFVCFDNIHMANYFKWEYCYLRLFKGDILHNFVQLMSVFLSLIHDMILNTKGMSSSLPS